MHRFHCHSAKASSYSTGYHTDIVKWNAKAPCNHILRDLKQLLWGITIFRDTSLQTERNLHELTVVLANNHFSGYKTTNR
jgi:hypothetical protein